MKKEIYLSPGIKGTVTFSVTPTQPGGYNVKLKDLEESFTVKVMDEFHTIHLRSYDEIQTNSIYYTGLDGPVEQLTANIENLEIVYWWNWSTYQWHMYWPFTGVNTIGNMKQGNIYQIVTYKTQDWQVPGSFYVPSTISWPVFVNPQYSFFYPHNGCFVDLQAQEHSMPDGLHLWWGELSFRKGAGAANTLFYIVPGMWYGCKANTDTIWHVPQDPDFEPPPGQLAIEKLFAVTVPDAGYGNYELHAHVRNIGGRPATGTITAYRDGSSFDSRTFTIGPGELYSYVWAHWAGGGANITIWVTGDWGEESTHMNIIAGDSISGNAQVSARQVEANSVVLRFRSRYALTTWRFYLYTPPYLAPPHEQYISKEVTELKGWTACYLDVKGLLSNKDYLYEGRSGSYVSQITFRTK